MSDPFVVQASDGKSHIVDHAGERGEYRCARGEYVKLACRDECITVPTGAQRGELTCETCAALMTTSMLGGPREARVLALSMRDWAK
jgi:hypothetical protein